MIQEKILKQTMMCRKAIFLSVPGFKSSYVHRDVQERLNRRLKRTFRPILTDPIFQIFSTNRWLLRTIFLSSKLTFFPFPDYFFSFQKPFIHFFPILSGRRHEQTGGLNGLKCRFSGDNRNYFVRFPRDFVQGRNLTPERTPLPQAGHAGQVCCRRWWWLKW